MTPPPDIQVTTPEGMVPVPHTGGSGKDKRRSSVPGLKNLVPMATVRRTAPGGGLPGRGRRAGARGRPPSGAPQAAAKMAPPPGAWGN